MDEEDDNQFVGMRRDPYGVLVPEFESRDARMKVTKYYEKHGITPPKLPSVPTRLKTKPPPRQLKQTG